MVSVNDASGLGGLTLGSGVRPARSHSSTSGGAFIEVALAASTNGSLMMLTVNSLVAKMFSRLSFGFPGVREKETVNNGGSCAICVVSQSDMNAERLDIHDYQREIAGKMNQDQATVSI